MRKKTETRRDAILSHALDVFRKEGFERASMSQIAAHVGGSKATLYNYFPSKEDLLLESMLESGKKHCEDILSLLNEETDFPTQLSRFVRSLIQIINSRETIEILRVAISVGGKTDVGQQFYERGTKSVWLVIAQRLKQETDKGHLTHDNPDLMATHLRSLCETDLIRNLLGAGHPLSEHDMDERARSIVHVFLRAYGCCNHPETIQKP